MTKDHWMYLAIGAAALALYFYFDEKSILKKLKEKGVTGLDAKLQARVNNA